MESNEPQCNEFDDIEKRLGIIAKRKILTMNDVFHLMVAVRDIRRFVVNCILSEKHVPEWCENSLKYAERNLLDTKGLTEDYKCTLQLEQTFVHVNLADEILGIRKDLLYLSLCCGIHQGENGIILNKDFTASLFNSFLPYLSIDGDTLRSDWLSLEKFLIGVIESADGVIDMLVTDWDGTFKTYGCNYATCMQPLYSAVLLSRFVSRFTKFAAVLTAGPLRNNGILNLICLPEEGYVTFGGSCGQEWILNGSHAIFDQHLSMEAKGALKQLEEKINLLLNCPEYRKFRLVGSGFQSKVDRINVGHQNVSGDISKEESEQYINACIDAAKKLDPDGKYFGVERLAFDTELVLIPKSDLSSKAVHFNKAFGFSQCFRNANMPIENGHILICGDTASDLPMVRHARERNAKTFAVFVNPTAAVRVELAQLLDKEHHICVSCPEILHFAMASTYASLAQRHV